MGVITVGSPLFSVVGTAGMTTLITKKLGGDYRPFYIAIAVLLVIVAVVVAFAIKDTPEDAGLYPDGADHPLKSEGAGEEVKLTIKERLAGYYFFRSTYIYHQRLYGFHGNALHHIRWWRTYYLVTGS